MQRATPDPNSEHSPPPLPPRTSVPAPLQLKIIGTQRHGHVIEIPATRCTIGSAADCTIRLRAAGVRPIHCVIVRGLDGRIIRSLSADTWLNGRIFREQSLRDGDHLRLGPIEFVVIDESAPPSAVGNEPEKIRAPLSTPPAVPIWTGAEGIRPSDILTRVDRRELQFREPIVQETAESGEEVQQSAKPDLRQVESTRELLDAAQQELAARTAEISALQNLLNERTAQYEEARQALQAEFARTAEMNALQKLLDERTAQWEQAVQAESARSVEISTLQNLLEERTAQWEQALELETARTAEITALRNLLEDRTTHWEQARQTLQAELNAIRAERDRQQLEITDRCEALREEIAQLTNQLQRERQNLQSAREIWSADCETLENQRRSLSQLNQDVEQRYRAEQVQFDMDREKWLTERLGLEQFIEEFRHRNQELELEAKLLTEQYHQIAEKLENLEARMAAAPAAPETTTDRQQQQPRSELTWLAERFAAILPPPTENTGDLVQNSDSSNHGPANDASNGADDATSDASPPDENAESPTQFAVRYLSNWQPPADDSLPLYQPPSSEDPTPVVDKLGGENVTPTQEEKRDTDVFERLHRAGILRDSEETGFTTPAAEEVPVTDEVVEPAVETNGRDASEDLNTVEKRSDHPVPSGDTPVGSSVEVEDSIESYMQRLLERVRGSDVPASTAPAYIIPLEEQSPVSDEVDTAEEVSEPVLEPEPTAIQLEDYIPRSQAPESNIDLNAMRELANDSRNQNILSHAQRTWTAESAGKLLSAFAALTVAFAAFFLRDIQSDLAAMGMVGGVGVGVYLLWQAFSIRRRLFDSLKLDTSYHNTAESGLDTSPSDASLPTEKDESPD